MEFNEKIQVLRKQMGLTQEELAEALYVSRTAVSKWESGRGYPSVDSLKIIAKFFGVTIDELLSGDKLLMIAEDDARSKQNRLCDFVIGLLDCGLVLYFILPFFGQELNGAVQSVSLLDLTGVSPYLKTLYIISVIIIIGSGFFALVLQNWLFPFWVKSKAQISLIFNLIGITLFIISSQPYAAVFLLFLIVIKVILMFKWK